MYVAVLVEGLQTLPLWQVGRGITSTAQHTAAGVQAIRYARRIATAHPLHLKGDLRTMTIDSK